MASKTVQPIAIELGIKGGEKLAALNRSFRDLSKQTKLSDRDINQATKDIVKFAKEVGNSEATIKGQIKAFEGLREQAAMGGKVYRELGVSIGNLKSALRGSSDAVERKRSSLVKLGSASKNSAKDLRYVIVQLEKLKSKVKEDSVAFLQLGKDIKNLNVSLKEVEISSGKARFAINTIISAKTEKITGQIEKLNDSIASGTLNAEDLNAALRKLELLRVGAGRGSIAFRANVFSSELGVDYFARLSKEYGSLEKTQAAITQRISEVNTELTNVTGYERRRALTVELIQLNKDLQNAIVKVTTKEQFQAMAIRQRMGGARESYSQSGFGAFSSSIRQRSAAGEFTPGMQRAKERARNQIVDERAVTEATELFRVWSEAYGKIEGAARNHKSEMLRIQTEKNKLLIEQQDDASDKLIRKNAEAFDRELALFDRKLSSRDRGRQRAGAIKSMFGLSGVDLSPLYEDIVGIGSSRQKGQQARMGKSYKEVSADIRAATAASNGSISSLEKQRSVWTQLRNGLDPASDAFKEVTRDIERVDRALEKTSRTRRRFSPGKAAQVAGATISGGIFGGPEGFLGGAIGGAVGGVGGSFAGAALGAQVGQLRQTLGGFADYAASITRLKIALEGITEVQGDAIASQGNYARAVAAAASVTKELNVPQEVAIKGITRLTAAVKGAGGGVADAELAFKNITAAITATGGGAEQVEGAVTALVQIFSKGKVSAEEINQIAERLPGTFNKIAEASGRTGPELTKALQSGEVGLNDLMKFLVQLGGEYGELAKKIAGSSESAGARLTVAYNNMRIEIGKALQPVGAEFQEAFLEFITDIGPDLVKTAKAVGEGMSFIIKNREAIGTAAALAAKLVLVSKAMKLIAGLKLATIASLAGTGTAAKITGDVSGIAAGKVALLGKALGSLAAIGIVTVGVNYVVNGIGSGKKQENLLQGLESGEFDNTLEKLPYDQAQSSLRAEEKNLTKLLAKRDKQLDELKDVGPLAGVPIVGPMMIGAKRGRLNETLLEIQKSQRILSSKTAAKPKEKPLTVYDDPTGTGGGGGGGGGGGKAEKVRKSLLDSIRDQGKLVFFTKARIDNELKIGEAQKENNRLLVNKLNNEKIAIDFAEQAAQVELQYRDALRAAAGEKNEQAIVREESLKRENATNKLIFELEGERTKEARRFRDEKEAIAKASEDELFNLRDQLGLVGKQEKIDRFRQSRIDAGDPNAEQQADLFRQTIDPTLTEGLSQNIRSLKEELEELVNPINQITGAASAIGGAFSQSFTDAISGSKSAKEALADFFKSVGSYFLDMAGQIIAKMVTMAILNAVVGLLPGGGGGGIGFNPNAPSITGNSLGDFGGGSFGGFMANGGPVSANTPYIVGERGPELFIPGASGSISNNDQFEAARKAMGGSNNSSNDAFAENAEAIGTSTSYTKEKVMERERIASINSNPIDVRAETTVINNVEYVTVEQFSQGMKSTARDAQAKVLSDLRNRPATRAQVGIR